MSFEIQEFLEVIIYLSLCTKILGFFFTIEQEIDSKTLSSYPRPNCLKVVIPKFGTRLKIYSKMFVNSSNMNNVILQVMSMDDDLWSGLKSKK